MIEALFAILCLVGIIAAVNFNYDALCVLRASGAQGISTETNTGVQVGPTGLCKAVLHATEVGGTLAVKLQGSATLDGTYYDLPGGVFLDPADGAAVDTAGKYEIYVKTDFPYIRTHSVVASAAATWESFLATAE
jgi:hypothetical protein